MICAYDSFFKKSNGSKGLLMKTNWPTSPHFEPYSLGQIPLPLADSQARTKQNKNLNIMTKYCCLILPVVI